MPFETRISKPLSQKHYYLASLGSTSRAITCCGITEDASHSVKGLLVEAFVLPAYGDNKEPVYGA